MIWVLFAAWALTLYGWWGMSLAAGRWEREAKRWEFTSEMWQMMYQGDRDNV